MKIEVNIRKWHLIVIVCLFIFNAGILFVYGYGTSSPATMGHSWGEIDGKPPMLRVESAHLVVTDSCYGGSIDSNGLCKNGFYKDITFSRPFSSIPDVIVIPETVSYNTADTDCAGGATDKVTAFPNSITTTGFRMWVYGSPVSTSCSGQTGWATKGRGGWVAIGSE